MKLLIFPVTVGILVIVGLLTTTLIDQFLLGNTDGKFENWTGLIIIAVFSAICATPIAIAAGIVRVLVRRFLAPLPILAECGAAVLSSAMLVFIICGIIIWNVPIGGMAGLVFALPVLSSIICGAALIGVNRYFTARSGASICSQQQ